MEQSYACVKSSAAVPGPCRGCGTGSKKICPENDSNPHVSTVETDHLCPALALSRVQPVIGERSAQRDTSKKIAATTTKSQHNTLPDHDVLLRARLAQSHRRPGQQVRGVDVLRRRVGPLDELEAAEVVVADRKILDVVDQGIDRIL